MRLHGQVIWITGSARRVGRTIALACAREGADVAIHCRGSREEGLSAVREVEALGRRAILVQGDHGRQDDVERMVGEIGERLGRLTALVNSAAQYPRKPFEEIGEEDFFSIIRANCYGPFLCMQKALPLLREAKPGRIVNLTDWAVQRPYRNYAHYMASKGGLHTMTMALARELAPDVLINAVAPGPVLEPEDIDPALKEKIVSRILLRKWGTPEAVAQAVLLLLETDYICGETITVDGGRFLG